MSHRNSFFDSFLSRNIVLVQAVGVCPIILAGTTLQNGTALAACTLAVLLPVSLIMSLIGERLAAWLRPPLYTLLASGLMLAAAFVLDRYISQNVYARLYIFLPLMAINTLFTYRAGGYSVQHSPGLALLDALGSGLGFGLVICIVSALREAAVFGTLWGVALPFRHRVAAAALPFAGFLILAFMAAGLQWFKAALSRAADRGRRQPHA